ncbi:MAG: thioesterase domain-containing protein [Rhizobiaceae bacterium]
MFRVALAAVISPFAALVMTVIMTVDALSLEAYIFRGAGDFSFIAKPLTFSEGMDRLGDKLEQTGVRSKVYRWEAGEWAYRDIMKRRPDAVLLAGHSMGAFTALAIASRLKGTGIKVAYMGLIDIPGPAGITPSNVEIAENFFHAFPVYGRLTSGPGHKGIVRNNLIWGQIHITMDNSKKIHNAMLTAAADIRGNPPVMQAYADPQNEVQPEKKEGLIAKVNNLLTGSISKKDDGVADEPVQAAMTTQDSDWQSSQDETGGAFGVADGQLPEIGPIPTPRPAYAASGIKLQPVQ